MSDSELRSEASRPRVFILGLGENGYGIVRSLAGEGMRLLGFHGEPGEFGRHSRYCSTRFLPPGMNDAAICRRLVAEASLGADKPVLMPTSDYYAALLAANAEALKGHFVCHWIDQDLMDVIVDKSRMDAVCRAAEVPVPPTRVTVAGEDVTVLARELSYPCIVKPNRSFRTTFPPGLKNFVAKRPGELISFYRSHPELLGITLCQEIIEGGDENIFQCTVLVPGNGKPPSVFCTRKLRQYPPGYGVMSFGQSETNPEACGLAMRLLERLQYRGLASLEFKYQPADGRYYFIEMNPRLPWYNALFAKAGVDLARLAYLDLAGCGGSESARTVQRDGVYWLSFKLDLGWFLRTCGRAGFTPSAWLLSLFRANCFAWLEWRDPMPSVCSTLNLVGLGLQRLFAAHTGGGRVRTMRSAGR